MTEINIEHIKSSLAPITHFPWYWQENEDMWQLFGGLYGHMQIIKAPKRNTDYAEYWPDTHDSYVISNAPAWLASLITTIESLKTDYQECERAATMWKRHSEGQELLVVKRESEIESQKEEIERLLAIIAEKEDRGTDYFDQAITELSPKKIDYKAITELAVKGLEEVASGKDWSHIMAQKAKVILEKIERLSQ